MALINTQLEFIGSGKIKANVDTVIFEDTYITITLPLAQAGQAALDGRFVSASILGALNELMDGLTTTSGQVPKCYIESVDTPAFVHTLTHNLNTFDINVTMYDANPASGPIAKNIFMSFTPVTLNSVRVELEASTSGHFIVMGCI